MRVLAPFLFAVLFASCFGCSATAAPSAPASAAVNDATAPAKVPELPRPDTKGRLTLAVGGQAEVAPGIVLTLDGVLADSRCPVDVNCVWAGEIRIACSVESPHLETPTLRFELATTAPTATARGLTFELVGATPAPRSTAKIAAADYRITLRVTTAKPAGEASSAP